ncbi:signal peptidase I [Paenibacillus eucommiae]|nr:signal peptidase I [Paenibacillus eucommiae]
MKTFKGVGGWVGSFGIAFAIALFIGIFIFQPYKVDGHSMDPTLHDEERVYVSKLSHTFSYLPDYGDIVIVDSRVDRERTFKDDFMEHPLFQIFKDTKEDRTFYVKRVIGKPGDVLEIKEHTVYRNGEALEEPYINEPMRAGQDNKWTVPDNHIFVMGDNRNHSEDSRVIGFIPLNHIMGKKIL